jgi:uncharacterized membrane protein YgcG
MMKIILILGLITLSLTAWTPSALAKSTNSHFNDPDKYISSKQSKEIETAISTLKEQIEHDIRVYMIKQMEDTYSIEEFTNDLTYHVYNKNEDLDDDSIFIVFSIVDRKMRIRTGKYPREVLTDSLCVYYLDALKPLLKNEYYYDAVTELLGKIRERFNNPSSFEQLYLFACKYSWWIFVGGFFLLSILFSNDGIDKPAEEKLKRIKEICEKNKSNKKFIETSCIICLDEFQAVEVFDKTDNAVDEDKQVKAVKEPIELQNTYPPEECKEYPPEEAKEYPPEEAKEMVEKNERKKKEPFRATLECGHTFHSNCISDWMTKQNNCPICREKIDKEEENSKPLAENLVTIQTHYHPSFSSLAFDYSSNSLLWNRRNNSSSSRSSWGSTSGGGSSSW